MCFHNNLKAWYKLKLSNLEKFYFGSESDYLRFSTLVIFCQTIRSLVNIRVTILIWNNVLQFVISKRTVFNFKE